MIATFDDSTGQGEIFYDNVSTGTGTGAGNNVTSTYQVGAYAGMYNLEGEIGEVLSSTVF